jgi:hypothetical protein
MMVMVERSLNRGVDDGEDWNKGVGIETEL